MNKEVIKHQPLFSGLSELHHVLNHLFDRNLLDWEKDFTAMEMTNWVPKVDVKEKDNQYIIRADIPGVNPKDIEVSLDNGTLSIKGKKESETKEEKEDYVRIERSSGSFYRALSLPNAGDESKITAKSKNGVLEITIPKNNKYSSHKIQIKEE
ncbi:MAG: Hsp20/alpha crystallin family protein [Gammaproteobacteria bacterium]